MSNLYLSIDISQPDKESAIATLMMLVEEFKTKNYCAGSGGHLSGDYSFFISELNDEEEGDDDE
ncbi:hypothetical protein AWB71_05282 [Caballeronia peredens]|nr:hypothetical protein AWB71_05282 [Caballeronia peredens]